MPEGDALHRAALRLQPLVGQRLEVESPNPRAQATQVAPRVDGRVLESVEAVGKNLLLRFEGGLVVRSHLRMTGRWRIEPRGKARTGLPWLVLRGETLEGVLWNGPVLTLESRNLRRLGQDVLADEFDVDAAVGAPARRRRPVARRGAPGSAARRRDREHVDGRGALVGPRVAVAARAATPSDEVLRDAVAAARRLMRDALATGRQAPSGLPARRPAVPHAAARSSAPAARATRTAPRTGARAARQEAGRRGSKQDGWRYALRTCT